MVCYLSSLCTLPVSELLFVKCLLQVPWGHQRQIRQSQGRPVKPETLSLMVLVFLSHLNYSYFNIFFSPLKKKSSSRGFHNMSLLK